MKYEEQRARRVANISDWLRGKYPDSKAEHKSLAVPVERFTVTLPGTLKILDVTDNALQCYPNEPNIDHRLNADGVFERMEMANDQERAVYHADGQVCIKDL